MNNDFQRDYLALLCKQVGEEIQYLVTNGHQAEKVYNPCMFCIDTLKGYYRCNRLKELKQFASSVAVNIATMRKDKLERKPIGRETVINTALEIFDKEYPFYPKTEDNQPIFQIK